jgi:hypothetical protein
MHILCMVGNFEDVDTSGQITCPVCGADIEELSLTKTTKTASPTTKCSFAHHQHQPCPVLNQYWIDSSLIVSASDIGITAEQIMQVISWGFSVVLLGGYSVTASV